MHLSPPNLTRAGRTACVSLGSLIVLAGLMASRAATGAATLPPHEPGVVLVAFRETATLQARSNIVAKYKLQAKTTNASPYFAELRFPATLAATDSNVQSMIQALQREPTVRVAQPNYILHKAVVPNDPRFNEQYTHRNTGQTGGISGIDIGSTFAWDTSIGSDNEVVAVIDSGVDYNHPDLTDNIYRTPQGSVIGYDYANDDPDPMDDDGHGTHCAGIIGARGNNGIGVVGVNHRVKIMPLKFLDATGAGSTADAIRCIDFATQRNVRVTSNSWGGPGGGQLLLDAILRARSNNSLFVTAAGNGGADGVGDNNDTVPDFPGNFRLQADNVINVAATDASDSLAGFSNFGLTTVDLGAPGVQILSTTPNNTYSLFDGTSMACPTVAGAASLIRSQSPSMNYLAVKQAIISHLKPITSLNGRTVTGGRLDIRQALVSLNVTEPNGGERFQVGDQVTITWDSNGIPANTQLRIDLARGAGNNFTENIVLNTPNSGSFDWTVTGPVNDHCRIRIQTIGTSPISDVSDAEFRIVQGDLTVDSPNGGEVVVLGTTLPITWSATGFLAAPESPTVRIEVSYDGGENWTTLFATTPNDGTQDWVVSGAPTFDALIRVTPNANPEFADESDDFFEIRLAPAIKLTYPNGGEELVDGQEIAIQWDTQGLVENVKVELSRNGGSTWETLFPSTPNETNEPDRGEVFWTVRGPFTRLARIRVVDVNDDTVLDTSNGVFKIQVPSLQVTAPVSGRRALIGQIEKIKWTTVGVAENSDVQIELSRDGGDTWEYISEFGANTGSLDWSVEGDETSIALIRVTSLDNPEVFGLSQLFSVAEPSIALTSPVGREIWRLGSQERTTWTGSTLGQGTVSIELSRNGLRGPWERIITNTPNDGGEAWGVRGKLSSKARIRIIWNPSSTEIRDESPANFRIMKALRVRRR